MTIVICLLIFYLGIFKFKASNGIVNIPNEFCLVSICNGIGITESRDVWLKGNVCDL